MENKQGDKEVKKPEPKPAPSKERIEAAKEAKDRVINNNQTVRK
jgi:DNA repair photolyase